MAAEVNAEQLRNTEANKLLLPQTVSSEKNNAKNSPVNEETVWFWGRRGWARMDAGSNQSNFQWEATLHSGRPHAHTADFNGAGGGSAHCSGVKWVVMWWIVLGSWCNKNDCWDEPLRKNDEPGRVKEW
jgi:hypothetical protein